VACLAPDPATGASRRSDAYFDARPLLGRMTDDVRDLLDATRLFLDRHEEALHSGVPGRALDACDALHSGLCSTLAQQIGLLQHLRCGDAPAAEAREGAAALLAQLARVRSGDARERAAWALASLRKRMAEAEGVLLHLRLTLSKGSADGPALAPYARRLHAETHAAQRALDALRSALSDWGEAVEGVAAGNRPRGGGSAPADERAMLRAARECLVAGVPQAAAPLLRFAAARAGAAALARELDGAPLDDRVVAWRLLDAVEYHANAPPTQA
jgi:hypothetical protein